MPCRSIKKSIIILTVSVALNVATHWLASRSIPNRTICFNARTVTTRWHRCTWLDFSRSITTEFLVAVCASRRFNRVQQRNDFKIVIITVVAFGKDRFSRLKNTSVSVLHLVAANAMRLFLMVDRETLVSCGFCTSPLSLGHNFVDMLDGRFQCLTCSKHVVGAYRGKEHAPHIENTFGEITPVECDQAGRIPICDKCARPVTSEEDAFKHETRFYHLECASCNRCRKKLFKVPCRKLGSALGKSTKRCQLWWSLRTSLSFSRLVCHACS